MSAGRKPRLFSFVGVGNIQILALDQSTKRTGFAIFKDRQYISSGLIDCDKEEYSPEERFKHMCFSLKELFTQVSPDFLIMEQVAYQRNAAALIELARLQGVLISICFDVDIPFFIYPPSSWRKDIGFKQGAGIKRKELKLQAIEYVQKKYGINANEDTAESIAMGSAFTITYLKENV